MTFTKEQLIEKLKHRISVASEFPESEKAQMDLDLARIALASLEAEPVAYIFKHPAGKLFWALTDESNKDQSDVIPVYAAPPVPVVPEEKPMPNPLSMYAVDAVAAIAEVRGWNACRAAMLQSGNFRENKNSSTNNFREIAETSTNYPVIPSEVLSAILKVAKIRADFDDFDGDRRGIGDCLDEAEQELIVTINKYASQLAAEPIATNDVREQTAVPPVPVIQADVAQAIEKLKRKLVECNRYNYCADAVKGVEYACHAAMLQGSQPVSQTYKSQHTQFEQVADLYEMQFDDGRTCAFHTDAQKAAQWLQACDENRVQEYVKLERLRNALSGNYPVTPDGWISCSDQMPEKGQNVLISVNFDSSLVEPLICSARYTGSTFRRGEATIKPGNGIEQATHWMPLPEPPQEVNRG